MFKQSGHAEEGGMGGYANVPRSGLRPTAPPLFRYATHPTLFGNQRWGCAAAEQTKPHLAQADGAFCAAA
jgi:hypothetical protein